MARSGGGGQEGGAWATNLKKKLKRFGPEKSHPKFCGF